MVSKSDHGRPVHAMLSDYSKDAGDWIRVLRFLPHRNRIDVLTVSSRDGMLCPGTRVVPDAGQHGFSLDCPLLDAGAVEARHGRAVQ